MDIKQAQAIDKKYVFPTYRRTNLLIERGKGVYVYDENGKKYLDLLAGIAVNSLGHCNSRVNSAINKQLKQLSHVSNLYYTEPMLTLAQRLCELAGMQKAFFANSGAEANEAAIKLVRRYHSEVLNDGRNEIICALNSFHGRTLCTLAATGQEIYQKGFFPLVPGFKHAVFNDIESVEKMITPKTAAIMVEPIQGEAGVFPATASFMKGLASLRKKHGIHLIFDEVQCGLGRSGKWFAFQHYGVKPDVVSLAKPIGAGLPLGVMMARGKVVTGFGPGNHATTFGAGPVVCAAANAFLDEMEEKSLVEHVAEMGEYIKGRINDLKSRESRIKEVRGKGLMLAVEFDGDAVDALEFFLRNGVIVNAIRKTIIRLLPPFIITKKHADTFVDLFEKYLHEQSISGGDSNG
ncbi:MAG TPA: aspartate aminotransferase family protein [bacterium]|nr:aspartate aminotransferase family protein [bacterium]